jgi:molecular chaperone GrpE
MTRHRIPIRVGTQQASTRTVYPEVTSEDIQREAPERVPSEQAARRSPENAERGSFKNAARSPDPRPATEDRSRSYGESETNEERSTWRDRALRLQAEMDNYRKRQRRVAQQEAQVELEQLLHDILGVADNLDRTLAAGKTPENKAGLSGRANGLRQGVELTRDDLLRVLRRYGLERFEAKGEPFDPTWHEAVHVVSARAMGVEPGTIVDQVQPGYRKRDAENGSRLFRPAQVVVAN